MKYNGEYWQLQKCAFKAKRTLNVSGYFGIYISRTLKAKAHSSVVMVDKWAHVCIAFFTQNSSYGNNWPTLCRTVWMLRGSAPDNMHNFRL